MMEKMKDYAIVIGIIISVITLVRDLSETVKQGQHERAEYFLELRQDFRENVHFQHLTEWITENSDTLATMSTEEKAGYAGFFEEIALLTNSDLVSEEVAAYTYGFYVIQCWESKKFWQGMEQDGWVVLKDFYQRMKKVRDTAAFSRDEMRF